MAEGRGEQVADEAIFILKAIPDNQPRPTALPILALVLEAGAVYVGNAVEREVNVAVEGRNSPRLHDLVHVGEFVVIFEAGKGVLPAGAADGEFGAGEKIILPRSLVHIRRQQWLAIEVPERLYAGAAVQVASA